MNEPGLRLKPFVAGVTKLEYLKEYLTYDANTDEWNIAQWDGVDWISTVSDHLYPVTHYMELPPKELPPKP